MNGKSIDFDNKNIKKSDFYNKNKKIKKNNTASIIHSNILLGIMITMLLDHYTYFFHKLLDTLINLIKIK